MATHITRMTVSNIAELAGVHRATVSNWQKRHEEFPKPLRDSPPGRPQFDAAAVTAWLAERYPEKLATSDRAAEIVRNWRYTTNDVQCDEGTDPLTLLIAAIQGERITYWEGGYDERYPVSISADNLDTTIRATKSQAEAIREFIESEIKADGVDKAELVERAAQEFDDLGRWRRTPGAVSAERNLHNLLAGLVHEESKTVLDFACGTGALLVAASQKHPTTKFVGLEPDFVEAFIADARLARRADAEIAIDADILENDVLAGRAFDAVVSIPPFGRRVDSTANERLRRLPFGPVRGSADAAWPQLAVQALAPEGEAFLVLPHSLASDDRSDNIRRELIQRGLLAAIVTLPSNALPTSKNKPHLWILSRRREPTTEVLFVDYSSVDPSDGETYDDLAHTLCNWLDDPSSPTILPADDPRFVAVAPIKLLGQTVILDPQYWCAHVATPTSAPELIEMVEEAIATLDRARQTVMATDIPACRLVPDQPAMMTVRDARDDMWLKIIRRNAGRRDHTPTLNDVEGTELPKLRIEDADLMWRGENGEDHYAEIKVSRNTSTYQQVVQPGDVLVWATPDRQIRATVSTAGGFLPSHEVTVLRCDPQKLNPHYVALSVATGRNGIHVTASTLPGLRALDLSFPLIPIDQQNQLASYAQAANHLRAAAQTVASAAEALWQALADATGSGSVGTTTHERNDQ
jgi:hypothetical protein